MKRLSLGYSPCPNDTFIFYALTHGRLGGDIAFRETLQDIETLNQLALHRKLDITKVSIHGFGFVRDDYCLLHAGSALGRGCGPLIISRKKMDPLELRSKRIAIPGEKTTAFLLLKLFAPDAVDIVEIPFDRIIDAVCQGTADAGVIIHESRFTYSRYGLVKLKDLGEWWEEETGLPIPLGGIIAKRDLGKQMIANIDMLIRKSLEYAIKYPFDARPYIKKHAQELDDGIIDQHISLYVNDYTMDIGEGINAVEKLLEAAEKLNQIPHSGKSIFAD